MLLSHVKTNMAAVFEEKSCKKKKGYSHEKYLLKAAELMHNAGEPEVSAELVREANDRKQDAEKRHELHNLGQSGLIRTPQSESQGSKDDKPDTGVTNFACRFCGNLQNPLNSHFRIKPKIRKRRKKCAKEKIYSADSAQNSKTSKKDFCLKSTNDEKSLICLDKGIEHEKKRKPKHARKCHFITSKCNNCNHIIKTVCEPLQKQKTEKKSKVKLRDNSQGMSKTYSNYSNKIKCESQGKAKVGFETPKTLTSVVSKSAKKKNRMKNSPLARLLADKKSSENKSPSLKSFLFNT